MIKHVVMIKVKDFDNLQKKTEVIEKLKNELDNLDEEIEEIRYLDTGINISNSPLAYDLVLITEFESLEDLDIYRNHSAHVKVLEFINEIKEKLTVVDYNFD